MTTVAELIVTGLADHDVRTVWGVVGDALNPVTDAIGQEDRLEWIGVRHEEAGAFAAAAQAQLTGSLGVCMGTVGPGSVHLLNGLYDAKKSHAPVLSLPADVPEMDLPRHTPAPHFVPPASPGGPSSDELDAAARLLDDAEAVTLLVGQGARESRSLVLELAAALQAPMVLTLKAKEGLEHDNSFEVGQNGLLGNPAGEKAFSDVAPAVEGLLPLLRTDRGSDHLRATRSAYLEWRKGQHKLADPGFEAKPAGLLRRAFDNPDGRIRPELVAASIDRHAAADAIFTSDTGMSTVWAARFLTMRGTRRLLGSFNLGSMANAMPQALGAQALDRSRQVVALCGDGGLTMLLGDLLTAVGYRLPVTFVVFNNRQLGMVKLEQEEAGLAEGGTALVNPDLAAVARVLGLEGIKVTDAADVDAAVRSALAHPGPVLLDVETNAQEVALPPDPGIGEAVGFAVGKLKEAVGTDFGGSP